LSQFLISRGVVCDLQPLADAHAVAIVMREFRESQGRFDNARRDVRSDVEVERFLPQLRRVFDDGETAERVCEIERRRIGFSIQRERFVIQRLGEIVAAVVVMEIAEVAEGVREEERVADLAADGRCFFIKRQRLRAAAEVAVDLSDAFERFDQFASACRSRAISSRPRQTEFALLQAAKIARVFRVA
jgi:hypothetical protein